MSLDAYGNPKKYKRMLTVPCATCRHEGMGVTWEQDNSVAVECPNCDASTHMARSDLPLVDQGTPQAEAALRVMRKAADMAAAKAAAREEESRLTAEDLDV